MRIARPPVVTLAFVASACSSEVHVPVNPVVGGDDQHAAGDTSTGDPFVSDPGPGDPSVSDPGPGDPSVSDPGPSDPGPSDPGPSDPGPGDPGPGDPGPGDPGPGDPGSAPPIRSDEFPNGILAPGTADVVVGLRTNEDAECRYADTPGVDFDDMRNTLVGPDDTIHVDVISTPQDDATYTIYVRCRDLAGNTNDDDYVITFSIAAPTEIMEIYRSVEPDATSALAIGSDNNLLVTSTSVSFDQPVDNRIGVGDIIQYDISGNGSIDVLAVIVGRSSGELFQVSSTRGGPALETVHSNDNWAVFRAYTSLANAIEGTENPGIDDGLEDFDKVGNPRDIATAGQAWYFACYGGNADTTAVVIDTWPTTFDRYVHIYTPHYPSEVGESQRHLGKWTDSAYRLSTSGVGIQVLTDFVWIDGLQVDVPMGTDYDIGISVYGLSAVAAVAVSNTIIRAQQAGTGTEFLGFEVWDSPDTVMLALWNNLIYGFDGAATDNNAVWIFDGQVTLVNNTIANSTVCVNRDGGSVDVANNIFFSCGTPAVGTFEAGSDYNATDSASIGYTVTGGANTHDRVDQTFDFYDLSAFDFHLKGTDTGARDLGLNLADEFFDDDIDGQTRDTDWDIGADEVVP
ncbi:hypothetical protein ACFL6C_06420 [Myxococcota bacterium]